MYTISVSGADYLTGDFELSYGHLYPKGSNDKTKAILFESQADAQKWINECRGLGVMGVNEMSIDADDASK